MTIRLSLKKLIIILIIFLLIFQSILEKKVSFIGMIDEILAISLIPIIIFFIMLHKRITLLRNEIYIFILIIFIYCYGVLCAYNSFPKRSIIFSLLSGFLFIKFILAYFIARIAFKNINILYIKIINNLFRINSIILFILLILNKIIRIFPYYDIRFGIKSEMLIFGHPMSLVIYCVIAITILSFFNSKYNNLKYILLNCILLISAMRSKGMVFLAIYVALIIYKKYRGYINKKLLKTTIAIISIISIYLLVRDNFKFYFIQNMETARNILMGTAFNILIDFFPFGTGFGLFASFISGKYYSPIYYLYGINNVYGLSESDSRFLTDSFLSMLMGEMGVIGIIVFIFIILNLLKIILKSCRNIEQQISISLPLIYMIVSMIAEASFAHPTSVLFMFIIGLMINTIRIENCINISVDKNK